MSILRLPPENFQTLELQANPRRTFSSSSSGLTGTIKLFPDASPSLKEIDIPYLIPGKNKATTSWPLEQIRDEIVIGWQMFPPWDGTLTLERFLLAIRSGSASVPMSKVQQITRFTPGVKFDKDYLRKRTVQKILFPYYYSALKNTQWNYTSYHCLNFVTGSGLPADSVMIYPAGTGTLAGADANPIAPRNKFTFDFWIKPKSTINVGDSYVAGTILHMSSCYAVSLVTGSSVGLDGRPNGFRVLFQLSGSADIPPRNCTVEKKKVTKANTSADGGFLFASSDNSLHRDTWHHVCIRWGGKSYDNGKGSFYIDSKKDAEFTILSASVMQISQSASEGINDPNALFVGNFYEGRNSGDSSISKFFNPRAHRDDGVVEFSPLLNDNDPTGIMLRHPPQCRSFMS